MLATFYFIDPWSLHFKGWLPYSLNADVLFNLNLDDTKGMDDIAKDYRGRAKDMFTVIALLGVVPACITILISSYIDHSQKNTIDRVEMGQCIGLCTCFPLVWFNMA